MRAKRSRAWFSALFLTALQGGDARANGRFPTADMLVAQAGDPSHLAVRTTFGLLASSDAGRSWGWICEMAPGYRGGADPSIALTTRGNLLVATATGLRRSSDLGCHWQTDATAPMAVRDFTERTGTASRIYALTASQDPFDGGGPRYDSALVVSGDDGATWKRVSPIDPTVSPATVEVAPSDPSRVYASGVRWLAPRQSAGVLLTSADDGISWIEHVVALAPGEAGLFIAAVDPHDANRVYLRVAGLDHGRLLVTDDAGASMRVIFEGPSLASFALTEDGGTVYAGGPNTGIFRAHAPALSFEKRSDFPATCLLARGATLWACSIVGRGSILSASSDDGVQFVPQLTTSDLRMRACSDPELATTCAREWADLPSQLPTVPRATSSAVPPSAPALKRSGGCGCSTPGAPQRFRADVLALVIAAMGVGRRQRRP